MPRLGSSRLGSSLSSSLKARQLHTIFIYCLATHIWSHYVSSSRSRGTAETKGCQQALRIAIIVHWPRSLLGHISGACWHGSGIQSRPSDRLSRCLACEPQVKQQESGRYAQRPTSWRKTFCVLRSVFGSYCGSHVGYSSLASQRSVVGG